MPFEKKTSPSAIPVYGLSDQTITVERSTVGWLSSSATKRLYLSSDVSGLSVIFNKQAGHAKFPLSPGVEFAWCRLVCAAAMSHKSLSIG
ncbi:hypothetical protein HKBW3S06_00473 [Candidatus Hakubella thermalkaliphila]|uniref:Uncharacterized protein n=1 Tax=Candidatus Hakubella thermalkaliphila TaxID=2754717 RepID=A0A6V8NME2_9ACTN|nr:hypothetical protein HKBW3S06_00473 [Candidatus Hakubella thermalkaliphila]